MATLIIRGMMAFHLQSRFALRYGLNAFAPVQRSFAIAHIAFSRAYASKKAVAAPPKKGTKNQSSRRHNDEEDDENCDGDGEEGNGNALSAYLSTSKKRGFDDAKLELELTGGALTTLKKALASLQNGCATPSMPTSGGTNLNAMLCIDRFTRFNRN